MGCGQDVNREACQLSHGAGEETTGTYKRGPEVCGGAGQSTQKGKEIEKEMWQSLSQIAKDVLTEAAVIKHF